MDYVRKSRERKKEIEKQNEGLKFELGEKNVTYEKQT